MPEVENGNQPQPLLSKEAIRGRVKEWIVDGLSEREISLRRAELAGEAGVSLRSLASVAAYVRYPATVTLKNLGLEGALGRDDLIWAAAYLETAKTDEEHGPMLRECAEQ